MDRLSGSDDLYVDLASSPDPSTPGGLKNDTVPVEIWIGDEEETTMPALEEEKLKNTEMNLFAELLESDIDKRKEKMQVRSDYEDLQRQNSHLLALIAEKDAKLSALTLQDANVRKNICSLYKTAKAEIDHKDTLLAEANKKLDSLLYRKNLTIDQIEKQMPRTSNEKHSEQPNEDKPAGRKNSKDSNVLNDCLSDGNKKNIEQSSTKRKRSRSPPSDNKNSKIEKNSLDKRQKCDSTNVCNTAQSVRKDNLNKMQCFDTNSGQNLPGLADNEDLNREQNCDSKNVCNAAHSVSKDNLNKMQSFDTNSGENPTKLIQTEISDANKSHVLNSGQNIPGLANNEPLNKKQNCDLNSEPNEKEATVMDGEPSIAEVFLKMQELASNDPTVTNIVFFNLLPAELRQSFLEFERTQTDALQKLKQSFVSCYFTQCSGSSPGTPSEENSGNNDAESQNPSAFFFQQNSSHSETEIDNGFSANSHPVSGIETQKTVSERNEVKTESDVQESGKKTASDLSASNKHSDLGSKPRVTVSEGNEVKIESDVQESGKKTASNNHSNSVSKPQGTVSEENEVKIKSNVQKSGKKHVSRHKSKRNDVLSLHKYRDKSLTLFTQRNIKKHHN